MKYRNKFEYRIEFGSPKYDYTCIGRLGGLHLHITEYRPTEFSGGLECHWRSPPEYMKDDAPSHDNCYLLQGACWHDGTSSYVSDVVIPFWQGCLYDHETMFRFMEREYCKRFTAFSADRPDTAALAATKEFGE